MYLLDTNILTALHTGNYKVINAIKQLEDPNIAITIITKVELIQGRISFLLKATNGQDLLRAQNLLSQTESLLSELEIVPFDQSAAQQFELLLTNKSLRKYGRADLLIASIALANRATLVTRNTKDFQNIPNLKLANWMS
jgi:tRNA(fMet)-specific endonuclease VapC